MIKHSTKIYGFIGKRQSSEFSNVLSKNIDGSRLQNLLTPATNNTWRTIMKLTFERKLKKKSRTENNENKKTTKIQSKSMEPALILKFSLTCEKHKNLLRLVNEPNGFGYMLRHCWMHVLSAYEISESHMILVVSGLVLCSQNYENFHGHAANQNQTTALLKPAHSGLAAMMQC